MTVTKTFGYTGGWQTYTMPAGVSGNVSFAVKGAGGGGANGGDGGLTTGSYPVAAGRVLYVYVGAGGHSPSGANGGAGGNPGGGDGGLAHNATGGAGGGGYSAVRLDSTGGGIIFLSAGGGGASGDNGNGGAGGPATGQGGARGTSGGNTTTQATGGTPTAGGNHGVYSGGSANTAGTNGSQLIAGDGGGSGGLDGYGGGGGGAGFFGGGGGGGGSLGVAPASGGGSGSNIISSGAASPVNTRGGGGAGGVTGGSGSVVLTHNDPVTNDPPYTPSNGNQTPANNTRTQSTGSLAVSCFVGDPNLDPTRAVFRVSTDITFATFTQFLGGFVTGNPGAVSSTTVTGLATNTYYYMRIYAEDNNGVFSTSYLLTAFYTDVPPNTPTSVTPANGTQTMSSGSVPVSAVVSDPDGGTVRALFRISTDGFASYSDIYSSFVASGGTATATLTGLALNTQYQMRVYAQDSPGLYSVGFVSTIFYTDLTPGAPTLNTPVTGANLTNTNNPVFSWTFNDADTPFGDSQTSALLQYRRVGDPTWISWGTDPGAATSLTIPVGTFTTSTTYEWQVRTEDEAGSIGPFSPSSTFSISPANISIAATGGMALGPSQTELPASAMMATAVLSTSGQKSSVSTVTMSAVGSIAVVPNSTIAIPNVMAASAMMAIQAIQIEFTSYTMQAVAAMVLAGTKSIVSPVLAMSAQAQLTIQVTLGQTLMAALATMSVSPAASGTFSTNAMATHAGMTITPSIARDVAAAMSVSARMIFSGFESRSLTLQIAVHGAMSQSAAVTHLGLLSLSGHAKMVNTGFATHNAVVPMHAITSMIQHGFIQEVPILSMYAHGSMLITPGHSIGFGFVDMAAVATMLADTTLPQPVVIHLGQVHMAAVAAMLIANGPMVLDGPYLTVNGVHGSIVTFTASSFPYPRGLRNNPTYLTVDGT